MSDAESLYQSYRASEAEIERLQAAMREADRACTLAHAGERAYRDKMIEVLDVLQAIRAKAVSGHLVEKEVIAMIDAAK